MSLFPQGPPLSALKCVNHGGVAAARRCAYCGAGICETCTFTFPSELHLCPTCATQPSPAVLERKKKFLVWAYVGAIVGTLTVLGLVVYGASGAARRGQADEGVNVLMGWLIMGSVGTGVVCSNLARTRGATSTWALRAALIWNWALAGLWLLFMIVGLMTR
jgi:hypothetical protein